MTNFMDIEARNMQKYLEKKAVQKKIYVVAPTQRQFIQWCTLRGIHSNNPGVTWINNHQKVLGVQIFSHDEVAFVARNEFDQEELNRIDQEIHMRTRKNEIS